MPLIDKELHVAFRPTSDHNGFAAEKSTLFFEAIEEENYEDYSLPLAYEIERIMYGLAIVLGFIASVYTIRKFRRCCKTNLNVAARLLSYKISLSVADSLILFVYAPTQLAWITTYWWYGGDILCRIYKFTTTFAFHLTGNMQVLIAFDRLIAMTHINKPHAKGSSDYNTRLFLAIAWIMAFVASLPQIFIFKIVHFFDNHPQCSSIWNEYAYLLYKEGGEFDGMARKNESSHNSSIIRDERIRMQEWEKTSEIVLEMKRRMPELRNPSRRKKHQDIINIFMIYNAVHVSLICVIPYLLELFFYALILALLSEAAKGEFSGIRRFIRKKIMRRCSVRSREVRAVEEEPQNHSFVQSHRKTILIRRPSRSIGSETPIQDSSSTNRRRFVVLHQIPLPPVNGRRMTIAAPINRKTSDGREIGIAETKNHHTASTSKSRRASIAAGTCQSSNPRVIAPWMKTVMVARRNTRRKAFLMLSFNLLLWLPYCAHAIVSSFVDLNFVHFQFASALVVFNAITNILL